MSVQYKRRRGGRKQYRRRKFAKSGGLLKVRSTLGPRRALVKMNFEKTAQFIAGQSFPQSNQFIRLNSIWDPDTDTAATQESANGYSNWNTQFERYRVYGVSYDVEFYSVVGASAATLAVMPSYGTVLFQDVNQFNQYYARKGTVGPFTGMNKWRVKGYYPLHMVKGQSVAQFKADNQNAAQMTNNPADQCFLTIGSKAIDISNPTAIQVSIKVTYHVELFEPVQKVNPFSKEDLVQSGEPAGVNGERNDTGPTGP